jgi:hypothetical protein
LAPIPAIAGHEKAPARLGVPSVVGEYLHQFGDMHVTIIPVCPAQVPPCHALVAFYDTEDESSLVATAMFAIERDGRLGRLLMFRFGDGEQWVYEGDPTAPESGEHHTLLQ